MVHQAGHTWHGVKNMGSHARKYMHYGADMARHFGHLAETLGHPAAGGHLRKIGGHFSRAGEMMDKGSILAGHLEKAGESLWKNGRIDDVALLEAMSSYNDLKQGTNNLFNVDMQNTNQLMAGANPAVGASTPATDRTSGVPIRTPYPTPAKSQPSQPGGWMKNTMRSAADAVKNAAENAADEVNAAASEVHDDMLDDDNDNAGGTRNTGGPTGGIAAGSMNPDTSGAWRDPSTRGGRRHY
jgi:hypothetical protein